MKLNGKCPKCHHQKIIQIKDKIIFLYARYRYQDYVII